MSRNEILLRHVDKHGNGIEIGPSYSPIASKKDGYNVEIIDCDDQAGLVEKYTPHDVNTDNIEVVDYVWRGEKYSDLVGKTNFYDWIIASHVIEHTTDLICFLNECNALLNDDGMLVLAVPDKRRCFDYFRPISSLSKVIDCSLQNQIRHSPGTHVEGVLYHSRRNNHGSWAATSDEELKLAETTERALEQLERAQNSDDYIDAHNWTFVPNSFRLILNDLGELGMIELKEHSFHPTPGNEFIITLSRSGAGSGMSRLELLHAIEDDLQRRNAIWDLRRYGRMGRLHRQKKGRRRRQNQEGHRARRSCC